MNKLSWLIYWAGTVNTIGGWLTFFAVVLFIGCIIATVWYVIKAKWPDEPDVVAPPKPSWIVYPLFLFCLIGSCLIPSRDTVLAIAASEMGEQVLKTPEAKRVGAALMRWIDQQTAPPKRTEETTR